MLNEEPGAVRKWEPEHQAPYAYINDTWVGYDDRESIRLKVFIMTMHFIAYHSTKFPA